MATRRKAFIYRILIPDDTSPAQPQPSCEQDSRITDISLNVGSLVLGVWNDGRFILACTNSGVECLNSRTFETIWYFNSTIVQSVCSDQLKVCFGTVSSGIYYTDFPRIIGDGGDNFLGNCKVVTGLTSSGINDICTVTTTTSSGFFSGGEKGVDIFINEGVSDLEVSCQLTCSGVNSVAYSTDTETYYWSTATTAYSADTCIDV